VGDRLGRFYAFRNDFATSVSEMTVKVTKPQEPLLFQNYPNPFNASTILEFTLPKSQKVSIKVYDTLGRRKEILFNKKLAPGFYNLKWTPQNLPSGIYFIQIKTEEFIETKKAVLQK
jgi:hypothetical protein